MSDQLDLLGYVAAAPVDLDPTDRIIGFMRTMASIGMDPTLRDVAQYIGTEGVLDEPLMAAWRDLVASGRIVPHSVPLEFEPDRHALHWCLRGEPAEPAPTMVVSTGPHLWEREQTDDFALDTGPPRPKLLLFDAPNVVHRLYHAPADIPLADRWGFALSRWRKAIAPDFAIAVFDGAGDGWRHALWPTYKANRNDDPSRRPSATDWLDVRAACDGAGLRWVCVPTVEADDLIASYTAAAVAAGLDVSIVSSDKDLCQLIAESPTQVRTIDPGTGAAKDSAAILERWGVRPDQLADVLALAGDSSDNYPGDRWRRSEGRRSTRGRAWWGRADHREGESAARYAGRAGREPCGPGPAVPPTRRARHGPRVAGGDRRRPLDSVTYYGRHTHS